MLLYGLDHFGDIDELDFFCPIIDDVCEFGVTGSPRVFGRSE